MKIRVEQDELKRAVSWAAKGLAARSTLQAHPGIRIESDVNSIRLTTFDAETATRGEVDAVIDEPGVAMVPGKLLAEITKELPKNPVEFTLDGARLRITCANATFGLPTYALDQQADLPGMPQPRGQVDAALFAEAVSQVQIAASRDDLLPPLTGIRMEFGESALTMAATDRYRLAIREIPWRPAGGGAEYGALVKGRQLSDLARSLDAGDTVTIALGEVDDGRIGFSASGRELVTRVMQGDFPSYRQLLPDSAQTTVAVDATELAQAVKRVKIVTTERRAPIKLSFADDEVRLVAGDQAEGVADDCLECSISGDPLDIAFNPELLLEGLNAARCDKVVIAFNGSSKAAILRPEQADGYRYLLMPMRFN
jgi:DNA polymerase-3 subunit beta